MGLAAQAVEVHNVKKALVIQPAFIGDAIISIAVANALKKIEPAIEMTYLVRPEAANLLSYAPAIDHVLAFDKYGKDSGMRGIRAKATELNRAEFDAVFCLHGSRRSFELVKHLNIPLRVGYGGSGVFSHSVLAEASDDASRNAARLAQAIDPKADISMLQTLDMPDSLLPIGFDTIPRPIVGIAPGSVWATKRWPVGKVTSLIGRLSQSGVSVVLIGRLEDIDPRLLMDDKYHNNNIINYISKLSLEASAAVISKLDVLVSNDSAPVHIAVATGTPVVDILGPTVREFGFAPRNDSGRVVELEGLWCRPCASHGSNACPTHTFDCMEGVSVESVLKSVKDILAARRATAGF